MIDSTTKERLTVSDGGIAGPYLWVPVDQLDAVTKILRDSNVTFWVDSFSVALNGKPAVIVINFGRAGDAEQIQRLLDAAA